jgi:hypothetical protein
MPGHDRRACTIARARGDRTRAQERRRVRRLHGFCLRCPRRAAFGHLHCEECLAAARARVARARPLERRRRYRCSKCQSTEHTAATCDGRPDPSLLDRDLDGRTIRKGGGA